MVQDLIHEHHVSPEPGNRPTPYLEAASKRGNTQCGWGGIPTNARNTGASPPCPAIRTAVTMGNMIGSINRPETQHPKLVGYGYRL